MHNYGRAGQVTGDNIIRGMRIACWIIKATDTRRDVILIGLPMLTMGSSVGIVTDYGLDGPGSNPGGD